MSILACPVCRLPLYENTPCLLCDRGHSFDRAREGYVNLLQNAKGQHGDNRLMLDGRRLFLEKGFYEPLRQAVCDAVKEHAKENAVHLDVGCGEGYYTDGLARTLKEINGESYAFDISRDAVKYAAKRKSGAHLFVGSAYAMPVLDDSIDVLTLLFSPFSREEILRVLKPRSIFVMAIPGERHLWGLKEAVYDTPYLNQVASTEISGFSLLSHRHIEDEIKLEGTQEIEALFSMTPYYYKTSPKDRAKLSLLDTLKTKIEFELLVYRKI